MECGPAAPGSPLWISGQSLKQKHAMGKRKPFRRTAPSSFPPFPSVNQMIVEQIRIGVNRANCR
jgi:hypothetical protein